MIISISILSYKVVVASTEITQKKNIIEIQKEKEKYLTPYGYTIDNPNIIINPYGISPLTALILFETKKNEEITVMIKEKDNTIKIKNVFKENTKHYIPIYGLYPNYSNQVIIKCGNITKNYTIQTTNIPDDLIIEPVINLTNDLSFVNNNGYIYALDSNNEIRWYLTPKYKYNILKLNNGNFLIPTSDLNNDDKPLGIMEIDLLGKVYKQYDIENGYYGSIIEQETKYLILSQNLFEIDKQTGKILKEIPLEKTYNNMSYNKDTNILNLENEIESISIDLSTNKKNHNKTRNIVIQKEMISPLYTKNNYIPTKGIIFKNKEITKKTNKNIYLIGYKKIDNKYKEKNIKIEKENDFIRITGDFQNKEVYLILDKFLDKRIYKITKNNTIIKTKSLKGKYSIYLKLDDCIYKTDKYIKIGDN